MKKWSIIMLVATVVWTLGSCGQKTKQVPFDDGDSLATANADPTVYGISGVATTMNSLQLITDTGDTLTYDLADVRDAGQVFGGLHTGDRMAVIPHEDGTGRVAKVINMSALLGNWVMPNPLDGSDEIGIRIKEGGIVEGIQQPTLSFRTWKLAWGRLEIVLVREDGTGEEENVLYDIVKVAPDSLVLKDEEEEYSYGRQRFDEGYGKNIKLEDASAADYDI